MDHVGTDRDGTVHGAGTAGVSPAQERARAERKDAGSARRSQLLVAAGECFDEAGYAAVTVEMIASRAQTTRPTFYAYFRSKHEIFLALVEKLADELKAAQSLTGIDGADPRQVLAATTRAYVDAIVSMGSLVALIDVVAATDPAAAAIWTAAADRRVHAYARYVTALPARAVHPIIDPERLVRIISDAIHQGAKHLTVDTDGDEVARERFVLDIIAITERLLGL